MPQPNKIPLAFAASGDKNAIPESTETTGLASWRDGFPAITSTPFSEGGMAPKRADFNGIFNALSVATLWQQQGGFYAYDNATDYEVGNVVIYSGDLYKCITANGPSSSVKAPTDAAVWSKVMTASGGTFTNDVIIADGAKLTVGREAVVSSYGSISMYYGIGAGGDNRGIYRSSESIWGLRWDANHAFSLIAGSSGDSSSLYGAKDGTLTWGGKTVDVLESFTEDTYNNGIIKLSSGMMIIYRRLSVAATGTTHTFPEAFLHTPGIVASLSPTSENTDVYTVILESRTATGFTAWVNRGSAHVAGWCNYIAIGRWK